MGRKPRISKEKTMKPNFFVFCEGKTEITYVKFLRSIYRVPIQIIPRKSDSNISDKYIENCKKEYITTENDKTFLMFDLDVEGMLERLSNVSNVILLVSNPCIELWFLLHYKDCKTELSTENCIKELLVFSGKYTKGILSEQEKQVLSVNMTDAINRSQKLKEHENPSTTIYQFIKFLNQYS